MGGRLTHQSGPAQDEVGGWVGGWVVECFLPINEVEDGNEVMGPFAVDVVLELTGLPEAIGAFEGALYLGGCKGGWLA